MKRATGAVSIALCCVLSRIRLQQMPATREIRERASLANIMINLPLKHISFKNHSYNSLLTQLYPQTTMHLTMYDTSKRVSSDTSAIVTRLSGWEIHVCMFKDALQSKKVWFQEKRLLV